MTRRTAYGTAAGAAVFALALSAPGLAAWVVSGSGSGAALAMSLTAPVPGSATAVGPTAVDVSFTPAPGQPAGAQVRVLRSGTTPVCTSNSSPCRDTGLTAGTSYSYTLQTVLHGWSATAGATLSASTTATLAVTTASLPGATVGTAYSQTLAASGGAAPYTWSVTAGSLPSGLALDGAVVSGTPTAAGTSTFTVSVRDANGQVATRQLSMTVSAQAAPATRISLTAPASWVAGTSQTVTLTAQSASGATDSSFSGSRPVTWGGTAFVTGPTSGTPLAPATVTFASGVATVPVTLVRAGNGTLSAATSGLTAGSAGVTTTAATVPLSLTCSASAAKGSNVTVTLHRAATDAYGNADPRSGAAAASTVTSSTAQDRVSSTTATTGTTSSATVTIAAGAASQEFRVSLHNASGTSLLTAAATTGYAGTTCSITRS